MVIWEAKAWGRAQRSTALRKGAWLRTLHLVIRPLALVLVAVGARVLAHAVVHAILPLSFVYVAAREDVCARAHALVVLPFANVRGARVVLDLAIPVPHATTREPPSRGALQPATRRALDAFFRLDGEGVAVSNRLARVPEIAEAGADGALARE